MRQAFREAGHPNTVRQGEVNYIADSYVHFPDPEPTVRTARPNRYVLVLQGDQHAANWRCPSILIAPMSAQTDRKRPWEYLLLDRVGGQPGDSIVKVHLSQPVPRDAIEQGELIGDVPPVTMQEILRLILINLGVVQPR